MRALIAGVLALALLPACASRGMPAPTWWAEEPPGSGAWIETAGSPMWADGPPPHAGHLRFVASGRSHLRELAAGEGRPSAADAAAKRARSALAPVVGEGPAESAAAAAREGLSLVARACKEQALSSDRDPRNTLWTAWALWEVPVATVVAPLPPELREKASAALAE